MATSVNIGELKNRLSGFLERVENGDEILVCKRNVPFATITCLPQRKNRSQPGWAASTLRILHPIEGPSMPPLLTRAIPDFPIGNRPLREHQRAALEANHLAGPAGHDSPWTLDFHPHAWLDPQDVADLLKSEIHTLISADGTPLAWRGASPDPASTFTAARSFLIVHPWDLLRANEQHVGSLVFSDINGDVHPSAVIEGVIRLGAGSRILPGVFIEGNVIIGENCKIGPNCYLRGSTSIGDRCHIGQSVEIKNCLILSKTNVGHLSYVGDSVLGEQVNFGAGTTVSNLRHDGKTHRSMVNGTLIDTGRRKFGTIVGDHVHTGINTSIYPGRKLWPHTSTLPAEVVRHDVTGTQGPG